MHGDEHVRVDSADIGAPGVQTSVDSVGLYRRWTHMEERYLMLLCKWRMSDPNLFGHVLALTGFNITNRATIECEMRIARKYRVESSTIVFRMVGQVELCPHVK